MTTTIKITELTNIGANLASSTVIPVVNMAGTPTTEKAVLGNVANLVLAGAGGNYVAAAVATTATTANTVLTNAQPNITSMGNLTGLTVSNVTGIVNFSNTANVTLGNVSNLHIAGGTIGQILSTDGAGNLSWASDTTTYGNSNVVTLLSAFGSNTISTTGNVSVGNITGNGQALTNIAGANVSGFVANANIANTAFSVAGANVSGFVANANIANTAFAVAAANVSGLGNIATINLTGNSSNVLYGNGVFAAVSGGANTGDITFVNTTISAPDDDDIVVQAMDSDGIVSSSLELSPNNTLTRVEQWSGQNSNSWTTSDWATGTYTTQAGQGTVVFTGAPNMISFINSLQGVGHIYFSVNGGPQLLWDGSGGSSTNITFYTPTLPATDPTTVTSFEYFYSYKSGFEIDYDSNEINIYANDADINLQTTGQRDISLDSSGDVTISANSASTWTFDTTGNLTLPLNSVVYETNIPDGALSGSAIALKPTGGTTANQQLLIYPTANDGDHIHMTSGNLYATELFLGSDNFYVKLANTGNIVINSNNGNSSNAMWTFDTTGNLSLPGDIIGPASANFTIYSNAAVHEFVFGDDGTFYAPDNVVLGGNSIYIGPGANTLNGIEHEVFIASSNLFPYVQAVVNNVSDNGSADWVALGAKGGDLGGQSTLGFTSSGFGDANYTITGSGDGYVLVQSYAPGQTLLGGGGNLILATGNQGTTKDIIFGTGGFLTSNIFGRISNANNSFELSRAGATIKFPDSTVQNTAWTGNVARIANGNSNVNIATANGNVTIAAVGNTTMTITGTGANITGTANISGNVNTAGQISATGNITTSGNFVGNGAALTNVTVNVAGNIIGTSSNVTLVAGAYSTVFDNTGVATFPGNISTSGNFVGNGANLSNVATKVTSSWTLEPGVNTVNISVPLNGTYTIWVNGNIPNGIITYTATAVVTNTNVPVLGEQYGWYYEAGNALVLTSIPNQFVGTQGVISNASPYSSNTANVFTFGITNNSGNTAVVNYGYTKL